jgi:hypothetical protein
MAEQVFKDIRPFNAAMFVDYKTGKTGITYPNENGSRKRVFFLFLVSFSVYWLFILLGVFVFKAVFLILLDFITGTTKISISNSFNFNSIDAISSLYPLLEAAGWWLIVLSPPIFSAFWWAYNYKYFSSIWPKFNQKVCEIFSKRSAWVFYGGDLDKPLIEIPYFENVYLGYEARGDFGDYLERVEIKPMPKYTAMDVGDGRIVEVNEYEWKAVFSFSKIPLNGEMLIEFI